jgi:hypothetical protein
VASHSAADTPRVVSIRMSSGPSLRKLKPRLASSTWGEEMPRSSRMPSTWCTPRAASASRIVAKLSCTIEKRGSFDLLGRGDRLQILVEGDQAARGRQLRQDQPAMTAAAEGAIYISTRSARALQRRAHRLLHRAAPYDAANRAPAE